MTSFLPMAGFAADALEKPDKITVHTWVREEMFAGILVDDKDALERGAKKLDRILASNPDDEVALSWRMFEYVTRAAWENDKGDHAAAGKLVERALATRQRIAASNDQGAHVVMGGSLLLYAARSPKQATEAMYRDGRDHLLKVRKAQDAYFAKLPPHFSGELLSQLVFAADRLGDKDAKEQYIAEMKKLLAGTPYERRAEKWQTMEIKDWNTVRCISCHEPGRLNNVLSSMNKPPAAAK
jgi:hypothetical protein